MQVRTLKQNGFTLVEIICIVALLSVLLGIGIPAFIKSRDNAQTKLCIENLRQLQAAVQQLTLDNKSSPDAPVMKKDLLPYIRGGVFPVCPAGGAYTIVNSKTDPTCSLSSSGHVLQQ